MRPTFYLACILSVLVLDAWSVVLAQPPGHRSHAPRSDQELYLSCRIDADEEPIVIEVLLELPMSTTPSRLDQVIELSAPLAPIRVVQYFPRAVCEQSFVSDEGEGTNPGIEVSIDGLTQSLKQWLVANDVERNRLTSLIGNWRYMVVADRGQRDELFAQFENELAREPTLLISRTDEGGSRELPVKPGAVRVLDDLGCKIHVRRYHPHFAIDPQTNKPVNLSDKRVNPAVLVEIEHDNQKEERWVFAKFPDFRADTADGLPFRVTLESPPETRSDTPDFALVTVGRAGHELWRHEGGKNTSKRIGLNELVEVPGSRYTFHIARFVSSGRLVEKYVPTDGKQGLAVLQIETTDLKGAPTAIWLERGKRRVVPTVKGPMTIAFGPRRPEALGGHRWPH
jgi:hypothetical protein